jgi:hypothetical protein
MTDQEKINQYEIIAEIRERIGSCFGASDYKFAGHPSDEKNAKELKKLAAENNISLHVINEIIAGYLHMANLNPEHIAEEFNKANEFFKLKLK